LQASLMARLDRLGPAKEVAQIGAAIGREFSHGLLAAVVRKPVAELGSALDGLIAAGLLFRQGVPPHATYLFKHALVQDAAYSTLLRSRRQPLHARIAATLEEQFPETAAAQPQLLAHHCTEAGLAEKAIGYRLKAGRQSVTRSAMPEAVTQFQKGLELVALLPADARREEREFDLLLALSPALIATRAYSSSAVGEMIARARLLADRLGRSSDIVPLLYGQWGFYNNRSEHKLALLCAEQIEQIGRAQKSRALQMMGYMYQAIARFVLGEFVTARALLEQCLGLSDPDHRATFAEITAEDPYVMTLSWLALALAVLGYIERGRACIAEALSAAQQLEKAHSRVYSRCFALVFASC
jgi:predicted ATPase